MSTSHTSWATAVAQAMTAITWGGVKPDLTIDESSGLIEIPEVFYIVLERAMEDMGAIRL